jgi:KaiC/GvpD/RAD55 family RecA-like ATPase
MAIERIKSGIIGLDDKMQGGFVKGSTNLVTGKTGTGKTAFCISFLWVGAKEGEPGLYVTTEERAEDIKADIEAMFGWDLEELEKKGLIKFLSVKPTIPAKMGITGEEVSRIVKLFLFDLTKKIGDGIRSIKAKRVVIDSVSIVEMFIQDPYLCRAAIIQLLEQLKEMGVTAMLTGTIPEVAESLTGGGIIEFLVDSVIKLDFVPVAERFKRTLTIRKMRRTDHSVFIHPFEITSEGLKVIEIE